VNHDLLLGTGIHCFQSFYFSNLLQDLCFPLRWQRHTLLQFLACVLAGANCKCVWLYALAFQ